MFKLGDLVRCKLALAPLWEAGDMAIVVEQGGDLVLSFMRDNRPHETGNQLWLVEEVRHYIEKVENEDD